MAISISCREVGIDCDFVEAGERREDVVDRLMRHVLAEHAADWFEVEEIYHAVCEAVGSKAA